MRQNNDTQSSVSLEKFVVQNNDMRCYVVYYLFFRQPIIFTNKYQQQL
jgi:hypothetical protein